MLMFEFLGGSKSLTLNLTSNIFSQRFLGDVTFTVTAIGGSTVYSGAAITFYKINWDSSITAIGTGVTNASGIAVLSYTISETTTPQNFYAYFEGNAVWSGSQSNVVSITVEPSVATSYIQANTAGVYYWTVPEDVYSVAILAIGAGGANRATNARGSGGGAFCYDNNISVTPGEQIAYNVGTPVLTRSYSANNQGTTWVARFLSGSIQSMLLLSEGGWQNSPYGEQSTESTEFTIGAGGTNIIPNPSTQGGGRGGVGGLGHIWSQGYPNTSYTVRGGGGGGVGGFGSVYMQGAGQSTGINRYAYMYPTGVEQSGIYASGIYISGSGGAGSATWNDPRLTTGYNAFNATTVYIGGNGTGASVSTIGLVTFNYGGTSNYGAGTGAGGGWTDDYPPSTRTAPNSKGVVQIMWGNSPTKYIFRYV